MTQKTIPPSSGKMGRPPLFMEVTNVRLPAELRDRIDAITGKHRRAAFIREAIEEKLARIEIERALEAEPD